MARLLHRLGRLAHRRRLTVVLTWLLLLAALAAAFGATGSALEDEFTIPGSESQTALDVVAEEFPGSDGSSVQVVVEAPAGASLADPSYEQAVQEAVARASAVDGVAAVVPPSQSGAVTPDGTTALLQVRLDEARSGVAEATLDGVDAALDPVRETGAEVLLGGTAYGEAPAASHVAELAGILLGLVVMAITLGSLLAAGLPLLTALAGVAAGLLGIWTVSTVTTVSTSAPTLALMLGLAVGIDYALLVVVRHRTELALGVSVPDALARATATAGSSVVFAGATVVIALLGLAVTRVPFLTVMGLAAAGTVVVAVLVAVTLLPALLALAGERLRPPPGSRAHRRALDDGGTPMAERWVQAVLRRPRTVLAAGVALLAAAALPVLGLQLALSDGGSQPADSEVRQAYDAVAEAFGPGVTGQLLVLADLDASADPGAAASSIVATLSDVDGVVEVAPPRISDDGRYALIAVVPATAPSDPATHDVVADVRAQAASMRSSTGAAVQVTGSTALSIDVSDRLSGALVPFALVVVGLSLVLLTLIFRSVLVPLTAALGYLLSLGAALGATVAVFQWGWLGDGLTDGVTGPLVSFMPIIVMAVLFGLAMDYQVFLVSRIHEAVRAGRSPRDAVLEGSRHAGRVVVAAALIMLGVFGSFVLSGTLTMRSVAFALFVGIAVDAFVVRLTLVPAVLGLLGERAWWLPDRLARRLPHLDVEGAGLAAEPDADAVREVVR